LIRDDQSVQTPAPPEAWFEWGGDGRRVVFAHANGFPPETYRLFLNRLGRAFSVAAFAARPLWPGSDPRSIRSWSDLANDLGRELDRRRLQRVVGVGHSLGSVLHVLAAAADPGRFAALALVDPVVFTGVQALFWGGLKGLGLGQRIPLVRGALRRREVFPSFEAVRESYSGKSVFATWGPEVLDDYIRTGFSETDTGEVRLRYPKAWEARIFEITPADVWRELGTLEVPILVIRGADSDTLSAAAAARIRRELVTARVVEIAGASHFVPMERPSEAADLITDWCREIGV
jgi:pimeloyl-ACP methyl ester carboxylesterase